DKAVFVNLRRKCSEVARQTICLAHLRRGLRRAENCVNEQPTNAQRASVMNFQFLLSTRTRRPRATKRLTSAGAGFHDMPCSLMMLTRLAVGLEPLNALDAAHRSPRSALLRARNLVPPL